MLSRAAMIVASMAAVVCGPAVCAQEKAAPDTGEQLFKVDAKVLSEFKAQYGKQGSPLTEVCCALSSGGTLSSGGVATSLESDITHWLLKGLVKISDIADKDQELKRISAIRVTAPDALEEALKKRRKAKLALMVVLERADDAARKQSYSGTVRLLDRDAEQPIYSRHFEPVNLGEAAAVRRMAARIAEAVMKEYVEHAEQAAPGGRFDLLVLGLDDRKQADVVTEALSSVRDVVVRGLEFAPGETSRSEIEVETMLPRAKLVKVVERVLEQEGIAGEVVQDAGRHVTVMAGTGAGIPAKLVVAFKERYAADQRPDFRMLVGVTSAADPNRLLGVDAKGIAQGMKSALAEELIKCGDVQYRDEFAEAEAQQQIVNALANASEQALAGAVADQYGRSGLLLAVGIQQLEAKQADDAAARVYVRLIDARREGKTLAQFALDWSQKFGFAQGQIQRQARTALARVMRSYAASATGSEMVTVQIAGLGEHDTMADAIAGVLERHLEGVQGRVQTQPPRATESGETVASYRFGYTGDARKLREELRRVFESPLGLPCRFYPGSDTTLVVRVGDALDVPPWLALTDPSRPQSDEFVQQLKRTLGTLGSPRFGVVLLDKGSAGTVSFESLRPAIEAQLRAAGCTVVSADLLDRVRQGLLAAPARNGAATPAAGGLSAAAADFAVVLRSTGDKAGVAELIDVSNGRVFGSASLGGAEMLRCKAVKLDPRVAEDLGRFAAGSVLTFVSRQDGVLNTTEVVVRDARSLADVDAVAELLQRKVSGVAGVSHLVFDVGVGRFILAYNGPFDVIGTRFSAETKTLPFKVRVDRSGPGLVEVLVEEKSPFATTPAQPPAAAPIPATTAPAPAGPSNTTPPLAPAAPAVTTAGTNYAVIVAVDAFEKQSPLHASSDAQKLLITLKQHCGYRQSDVRLLTSGFADNLAAPTKRNIMQAIERVAQAAGPDDSIMVVFSTHGTVREATNETMLVPCDESNGLVSVADIRATLGKSKARASVLVLDACQSAGRFDRTLPSPGAVADGIQRESSGLITLAGCQANEMSLEVSGMGGLFTHFLCLGLRGEADRWDKGNKNNEVSLGELYVYTHDRVSQFAKQLKDENGKAMHQNPTMLGIQTGDIVVSRLRGAAAANPPQTPAGP